MKKIFALCTGLTFTLSAQAHMLWLERDADDQTRAYFGEYSEQVKETQDTSLKSFNSAVAEQNKQKLKAKVQSDHLAYASKGAADVKLSSEMMYGEALLSYHAKAGRSDLKAVSELDIVPVQANSNTFAVFYQGKPAAGLELTVFSPQFWQKKYTANSQGQITIDTPWKGQYVIEVSKESDKVGKFNQQNYSKQYLVTTLSFIQ